MRYQPSAKRGFAFCRCDQDLHHCWVIVPVASGAALAAAAC